MSDDRLDGKVVLVTGSSSGIGEAVARRADALGASVVVNSVRSVEAGTSIAASLKHAIYVQGDVALEADCQRMVDETLERFGRLDVLVNNAGVTKLIEHKDLDAASVDVFREIFDVNVFGTWAMTMAAVPSLRLHHGRRRSPNGELNSLCGIKGSAQSPHGASCKGRWSRHSSECHCPWPRCDTMDRGLGFAARAGCCGRTTEAVGNPRRCGEGDD